MVNFTFLLLLFLIKELAGIPDGDIDTSSKLKLKLTRNGGSSFSKKLQSLKEERLKSWIRNNLLLVDNSINHGAHRDGFQALCQTFILKLATKICKKICLFNGICFNLCTKFRKIKICTT